MSSPKQEPSIPGELSESELEGVQGGMMIPPVPNPATPKPRVAASIAEGEINSDSADDNLPGSSGGIIR